MDLIDRQKAIEILATMQGLCTSKAALVQNSKIWQQIKDLPSAEPEISRIEKELHGKTPEEQYDFIYWLLFKSALNYSNSRLTIIEWLKGEKEDG